MRKPRPDAFNPHANQRTPDPVDMTGVVPLQAKTPLKPKADGVVSRYRGITTPQKREVPVFTHQDDLVQHIRKAVKVFGKEAATHRFTLSEKKAIAEIVFDYRSQGIRTSENEIARIAMNYLFLEYRLNGKNSILHQTLVSLNQ